MTHEEAKILLRACRPDRADTHDPRVAEALALAGRDPELRAWFEAEQAADRALAAKLKAAPLPEDLLACIRAGTRARIAGQPRRRVSALALAACLALLGLIAAVWLNRTQPPPAGSFAACRADMAQFLREFPKLEVTTDRLPEVREWLSSQHPLTQAKLPLSLEKFPSIGCRTVAWQNRKIALVCYMVEGQVVHVFVLPRSAFPETTLLSTPQLARVGSQNTAAWSGADNLYLIVTQADEAFLRRLL